MKGNYVALLSLAAVLAAGATACHGAGAPAPGAARHSTLSEAVKPEVLAAALRKLGGAHYHATLRMSAGRPGAPAAAVTTTTDVWVDRAGNYRFHEENDRDGGRDVVLYGRELAVALRYGKMIRRIAEEPEPKRLLEEALGGPSAAFEIAAPRAHFDEGGLELVGGAGSIRYTISLGDGVAAPPPHAYGLRAWRTGVTVDAVTGRALVDGPTGALVALDLTVAFRSKTDSGNEQGSLEVHTSLAEVASTPPIARPAAEELVLRQRTVPEARELLHGLAEPRGAGPAKERRP
ncbi:MAG TPA: hypothetical protein VMT03_10320 [Polyangia bacterium]|nr:hypothetical protein [Polyangia bacterium]